MALSYVRTSATPGARELTDLPLIAKIEKQQALERIDAILEPADAIMVARGDLGVEMPIERVPAAQKRIINAANLAGRPVITATQMLVSMVTNPIPTRAEVTDVANAVLDGTDAVMLSEETASARFAGAVNMMNRLCSRPSRCCPPPGPRHTGGANALAHAAAKLADDLDATAIVVPTRTGISAQRLAPSARTARSWPTAASPRPPAACPWSGASRRSIWRCSPARIRLAATLEAARRDLGAGARLVLLDINGTDTPGVAPWSTPSPCERRIPVRGQRGEGGVRGPLRRRLSPAA